jgi:hypothetical protein
MISFSLVVKRGSFSSIGSGNKILCCVDEHVRMCECVSNAYVSMIYSLDS